MNTITKLVQLRNTYFEASQYFFQCCGPGLAHACAVVVYTTANDHTLHCIPMQGDEIANFTLFLNLTLRGTFNQLGSDACVGYKLHVHQ